MRKPSINLSRIKRFFQKISHSAAERPLFFFLVLLIFISFFGAFLFYKNVILIKNIQPEILEKNIQLNEKPLEDVLKEIDLRQKRFEEADKKQYPNFFGSSLPPPVEIAPSGTLTE